MTWFTISLLASFCWSITNHTDKYILQKYFKSSGLGGYATFSIAIGLIILLGIFIARPMAPFVTGYAAAVLLMLSGLSLTGGVLLYAFALSREDASTIVPFFQLIPLFAYAIEYLFLGVQFTQPQIIGSAIILIAAILISLDLSKKWPRIKFKIFATMSASSLLFTLNHIFFKIGSNHPSATPDYWNNSFWQYVGTLLVGVFFFVFIKKYREQFIHILRANGKKILALNAGNELFNESGNRLAQYAVLLVPVSLVQIVNGFQSVFVFVIGIILTIFFPHLAQENISPKNIAHKSLAIALMIVGAFIMTQ